MRVGRSRAWVLRGGRRRQRRWAAAVAAAVLLVAAGVGVAVVASAFRSSGPRQGVLREGRALPQDRPTGQDVAWPQCPSDAGGYGLPMPPAGTPFTVLGLTAGRGFSANPCLDAQIRWLRERRIAAAAYLVPSYPTPLQLRKYGGAGPARDRSAQPYNVGWAQARHALGVLATSGMRTRVVWIDVEPVQGHPWSKDPHENAAFVRGVAAAIRSAHLVPGLYTNSSTWNGKLGRASLGLPEWRTVGGVDRGRANRACGRHPLNGGRIVMVQYWTDTVDADIVCGGLVSSPGRKQWFVVP